MIFGEYYEIFKNTYFKEHLGMTALQTAMLKNTKGTLIQIWKSTNIFILRWK